MISLGIFLVGCIGCAFAWNIGSLIAFRALAGCGAAVFPLSFAIIRDEFPPEKVGVGIGLVSAVFGVGGGFGIVLSGLIVDHLSWRWLFVFGSVRDRGGARARRAVRPRVADQDAVSRRPAGRVAPLGRARGVPARAHRG